MSLAAGARLGPYEVLGLIGAGGMGEVYKARDTRLDRTVAIKVLPADISADPGRRARFEREAKTIAGLTHPHICTLYDVGEHADSLFLVMEHLDGETLAHRIGKGRLPIEQALTIAIEIADALSAAHRHGIIHRDLKPANVMLTKSGAKLLDFGLAKVKSETAGMGMSSVPTQEPATAAGTLLGTVPYMAPEQLEGKETDARSDIFSFGGVLYEMLTGQRAFRGESQASIISAIMSSQPPPISSLQPIAPPALDRLVQRCLEKDPEARWQTATDVAAELRWISTRSGSVAGMAMAASRAITRGRMWPYLAATALLLVGAGALWWGLSSPATPLAPAEVTHTQVTFTGDVDDAALAPDGRTIAYTVANPTGAPRRLMVQDIDSSEAREIWQGYNAGAPAWMPDGRHVLISGLDSGLGLAAWLVPRFGGTSQRVDGVKGVGYVTAPSPNGSAIAYTDREKHDTFHVLSEASGNTVTTSVPDADSINRLSWDRHGERIAVFGTTKNGESAVWVTALGDGSARRIRQPDKSYMSGCWSTQDDALYLNRALEGRGTRDVVRVTFNRQDVAAEERLLTGLRSMSTCQVSADGQRLLQVRSVTTANIWRLDIARPASAMPLTTGTWYLQRPEVSSDGQSILATAGWTLVRIPIAGGSPAPFMAKASFGRWSRDGRRIAFVSSRTGSERVWVADANGENAAEVLGSDLGNFDFFWWPDGRLAWRTRDLGNYRIRDLATGHDELLRTDQSRAVLYDACPSGKGDQVAVFRANMWFGLISWPERRERRLASAVLSPVAWAKDGASIYAYRWEAPEVVRVSVATGVVQAVGRFPIGSIRGCSMTPDGATIVCGLEDVKTDVWVVDHFDPHVSPPKP